MIHILCERENCYLLEIVDQFKNKSQYYKYIIATQVYS
jgi:hypothetical protein